MPSSSQACRATGRESDREHLEYNLEGPLSVLSGKLEGRRELAKLFVRACVRA
jgi:hypothetical protein